MRVPLWLTQVFGGCHHSRLSNVFTIDRRTYQVCLECGQEFPYSWERMHSGICDSAPKHAWTQLSVSRDRAPAHDAL